MDLLDLIKAIPEILQYFVSGYIFVKIFAFVVSSEMDTSITMIFSCVISFVWIALVNSLIPNTNIWLAVLISCGLSIVIAPFIAKMYVSRWFRRLLVNFFCKSSLNSIWAKVIDFENGTNFKVYLKNKSYYIIGHYDSHENKEEDFWFSLRSYIKVDINKKEIIADFRECEDKYIVFNSKDIDIIEIF